MPYARAPISEAILDIRAGGISCDLSVLRSLGEGSPEFPEVREIKKDEYQVRLSSGQESNPVASRVQTIFGYQFWSSDKTRVWQARNDGFTISHLRPYENWETLIGEATALWRVFRSATGAIPTRLAVRYINRFDIPCETKINYEDYFRTVPQIPPELDTGLAGYLMQLIIPQQDLKAVAILTQTPTAPPQPNIVSLILDIDLYREIDVPQDDPSILDLFESFRKRKNHLFEMSLQEKARELIR